MVNRCSYDRNSSSIVFNAIWWVIVSIPFASPALTTIFLFTNALTSFSVFSIASIEAFLLPTTLTDFSFNKCTLPLRNKYGGAVGIIANSLEYIPSPFLTNITSSERLLKLSLTLICIIEILFRYT